MKLPQDIIYYALFGIVLIIVGMAAQNIYQINQTINRAEQHLYQNTPYSESRIMIQSGVELE